MNTKQLGFFIIFLLLSFIGDGNFNGNLTEVEKGKKETKAKVAVVPSEASIEI